MSSVLEAEMIWLSPSMLEKYERDQFYKTYIAREKMERTSYMSVGLTFDTLIKKELVGEYVGVVDPEAEELATSAVAAYKQSRAWKGLVALIERGSVEIEVDIRKPLDDVFGVRGKADLIVTIGEDKMVLDWKVKTGINSNLSGGSRWRSDRPPTLRDGLLHPVWGLVSVGALDTLQMQTYGWITGASALAHHELLLRNGQWIVSEVVGRPYVDIRPRYMELTRAMAEPERLAMNLCCSVEQVKELLARLDC